MQSHLPRNTPSRSALAPARQWWARRASSTATTEPTAPATHPSRERARARATRPVMMRGMYKRQQLQNGHAQVKACDAEIKPQAAQHRQPHELSLSPHLCQAPSWPAGQRPSTNCCLALRPPSRLLPPSPRPHCRLEMSGCCGPAAVGAARSADRHLPLHTPACGGER